VPESIETFCKSPAINRFRREPGFPERLPDQAGVVRAPGDDEQPERVEYLFTSPPAGVANTWIFRLHPRIRCARRTAPEHLHFMNSVVRG
jgi:hypothetical protein